MGGSDRPAGDVGDAPPVPRPSSRTAVDVWAPRAPADMKSGTIGAAPNALDAIKGRRASSPPRRMITFTFSP